MEWQPIFCGVMLVLGSLLGIWFVIVVSQPPNIPKLKAQRRIIQLIQALSYTRAATEKNKKQVALSTKQIRQAAAEALGEIGDARAVKPLCAALKDNDVRWSAAEALGKIGAPAVEPLCVALKDSDKGVRRSAVETLGKIGVPAVEPLCAALKHSDEYVRVIAVKALAKISDAHAVEPLCATLMDSNESVRRSAAEALIEIGDARAVGPLCAALREGNEYARRTAAQTLVTMYQSGKLDKEQQAQILSHRDAITHTHTDRRGTHRDRNTNSPYDCSHDDVTPHEDVAGIVFPV